MGRPRDRARRKRRRHYSDALAAGPGQGAGARGEVNDAERLAREAVAVSEGTDFLDPQGDVYADLAEVLLLVGSPKEAGAALRQALERYERKGNIVSTRRTQARLAELEKAATL